MNNFQDILTDRNKIKPTDIMCGIPYSEANTRAKASEIIKERNFIDPDEYKSGMTYKEYVEQVKTTVLEQDIYIEVNNLSELRQAISNKEPRIRLKENIIVSDGAMEILYPVTIKGTGKTLTFANTGKCLVLWEDATVENLKVVNTAADATWSSTYGIQFFKCSGTVKDVTVSGCNGGILVNSATVILKGTIDLSGNTFGGIEVSQSSGDMMPKATLTIADDATIINTTEQYTKPTIWKVIPGNTVVGAEGFTTNTEIKEDQVQYYMNPKQAVPPVQVPPVEEPTEDEEEQDPEETGDPKTDPEGSDEMEPVE